jgi:sulfopyruvate decarboxylase subunit alpha
MPVSTTGSRAVYEALKACGVTLVPTVPETWLVQVVRLIEEDPTMTMVHLAKEEEGVGIAAGAYLSGVNAALIMQNHGLLACINPIVSLIFLYKIPLLMLISYRGDFGERDPWQTQGGLMTEPVLRALNIPYRYLSRAADAQRVVSEARALANAALHPVAVLLSRELLWED